MNIIR